MLTQEFQYYLDHQDELVQKYNGKFLVIKDCKVAGTFNEVEPAYEFAISKFELGTFLIQKCSPGKEDYTQVYHSRVIFS